MAKSLTIQDFFRRFPDDDACLSHLFDLRYGAAHPCSRCGLVGGWRRLTKLPAYTCRCGHHLHPTVGTIFQKSHVELTKWFYAIYLFTTTRHGVPAKELERQLGVSYPTAFRMAHLIRQHMGRADGEPSLSGHVEADETYVGGRRRGLRGRGATCKAVVFGVVERGGSVVTRHIPRASKAEIFGRLSETVRSGSIVSTDEWRGYERLGDEGFAHGTVCHGKGQWRSGAHHTNTLEGYWSLLKRSIQGTHVHVSRQHMAKYLDEFEFRYNLRHSPQAMFDRLVSSL